MSQPAPAAPVADMTAAILPPTHPLLLLPIRIETALDGNTLRIRVYPDEIHLDRRPTAAGGQPTARPRLLPDRFIATGWRDGTRVFSVTGTPVSEDALRVTLDLSADAPADGMDWLGDFTTAVHAGMALSVTLDQPKLDRLLVFGVRSGLDAGATSAALTDLLGARDDVRFVAPGDPTNQGGSAPATTAVTTPAGGTPSGTPAGARLAAALGLPSGSLDGYDGAAGGEDAIATAMHAALWPATWGYYLIHRVTGRNGTSLSPTDLERGRRAFIDHVRAEGPLPTLRVGDQPYGFLPATSLDSWIGAGESLGAASVDLLRRARAVWLAAAATLPKASDGPDALLEVLRNSETTSAISARTLMGPLYAANLLAYVSMPELAAWCTQRDQLARSDMSAIGLDAYWNKTIPPAAHATFAPNAYPLRQPFVADTSPAYLRWLATLDPAAPPVIGPVHLHPRAACVLDDVARHAMNRAYADASGQPAPEGELLGFGLAGQVPLVFKEVSTPELTEMKAAMTLLGAQPADALARHFTRTLDLAAHRLDAWITAVATERLATLRAQTSLGLRVGAFGWVEGLVPRSAGPASEGWIAAPSLAHATTAAVLRNGYRARRLGGEVPGTLAVDLSSRRVRRALLVLDEVRAGRTLGAVLGEQLERALHDAHLDPLIYRFRSYARVAGGDSTDGLALAQQWVDHNDLSGFDFGSARTAVTPLLDALTATLDAVADLALAEGVHQLVNGNPVRAGAIFDALGRGEQPPPEITVATTPRRAVHHTVRLLVALPDDAARPAADWPTATGSPRATAEPRADAWAAQVLGPAAAARFTVTWTDSTGHATQTSGTVADTGLAPSDVVALAGDPNELDAWLIWAVAKSAPADTVASVTTRPTAFLELAATLRRVFTGARAATPADLDPDASVPGTEPPADPGALARAATAAQTLDTAIANVATALAATDPAAGPAANAAAALSSALVALAKSGVSQALPTAGESVDASRDRATQALTIAKRRAAAASAATGAAAVLSALFDEPFPVFGTLTTTTVAQRDAPNPAAAIGWLDQVGRVRAGTGALSDVLLYDEALGRAPSFALAQLPNTPDEPSFIADAAALTDPRQVTLVHLPQGGTLPAQAAALLVDGWVEPVPNAAETAGIAFHLQRPASQPPQACLIAVPPDRSAPWSTTTLEAVLLETLDAARMRAVPADALDSVVQFLPALQFAANTANETVSTSFTGLAAQ